jgi:hypothetical protein
MSLDFLKDEEIQAYLDGDLTAEEINQVEFKINLNEENRHKYEQYLKIYNLLKESPEPSVSPSFIDKVMTAIPAKTKASIFSMYREIWLALAGMVVSLGVLSLVIDLRPVTNEFINIFNNNFTLYSERTWQFLLAQVEKLNGGLMIILMALLVLAMVKIADYLLLQPKYRRIWS